MEIHRDFWCVYYQEIDEKGWGTAGQYWNLFIPMWNKEKLVQAIVKMLKED